MRIGAGRVPPVATCRGLRIRFGHRRDRRATRGGTPASRLAQGRFGYETSNVDFVEGDIARLDELDLEPASFDVIVSNCVINLVTDKAAVFSAAHRLLKEGGELYFSDVYADRRLPSHGRKTRYFTGSASPGHSTGETS